MYLTRGLDDNTLSLSAATCMNVSSIVIKASPERFSEVLNALRESEVCALHFHDSKSAIVVTIEGENVDEEMEKMKELAALPNVLSAELIYTYSEDESKEAKKLFEANTDSVPNPLKDA